MAEMLTTAQAAARLGVHPSRIRHMVRDGLLPAERFGRDLAIPAAAVEEAARTRRRPGRPPRTKTGAPTEMTKAGEGHV
jgi:excisionase family DNA binding protein